MRVIEQTSRLMASAAFALLLSACGGGGGGGGGGVASTPPPPPPPNPPPAFSFIKVFPSVTQTTDFAVLGYENSQPFVNGSNQLITSGFSVRYDATADAYLIDVPSSSPGRFGSNGGNENYWFGILFDQPVAAPNVNVFIQKPTNSELSLAYTTFGDYYSYEFGGPIFDGVFAFGQATPVGAVPTTGSATYSALLLGRASDWSYDVLGTASLSFNFGAGTLSGQLNPVLGNGSTSVSAGTYNFVNTIFGIGSTTFSGGLLNSANGLTGNFSGQFTGPQAQELMARWTAQFADPNGSGSKGMYGVLVGKRP